MSSWILRQMLCAVVRNPPDSPEILFMVRDGRSGCETGQGFLEIEHRGILCLAILQGGTQGSSLVNPPPLLPPPLLKWLSPAPSCLGRYNAPDNRWSANQPGWSGHVIWSRDQVTWSDVLYSQRQGKGSTTLVMAGRFSSSWVSSADDSSWTPHYPMFSGFMRHLSSFWFEFPWLLIEDWIETMALVRMSLGVNYVRRVQLPSRFRNDFLLFFFWFCFLYFLPFFCLRLICYVEYYNMIMNVFNWASEQHQCGGWSFQETWRCFSKSWGRIPNDSLEIRWIFSRFLSEIPSGGCASLFQFI